VRFALSLHFLGQFPPQADPPVAENAPLAAPPYSDTLTELLTRSLPAARHRGLFHFEVVLQRATFGGDGTILDSMTIKHVITDEEITLYNRGGRE